MQVSSQTSTWVSFNIPKPSPWMTSLVPPPKPPGNRAQRVCCGRVGSRSSLGSAGPPQWSNNSSVRFKRLLLSPVSSCCSRQMQGVVGVALNRRRELRVWCTASAPHSSAEAASPVLSTLPESWIARVGRANSSTRHYRFPGHGWAGVQQHQVCMHTSLTHTHLVFQVPWAWLGGSKTAPSVHAYTTHTHAPCISGSLGTAGRECNSTSLGPDGCDIMCCGRGHSTTTVLRVSKCDCKFHWCCYVRCRQCRDWVDVHTCKGPHPTPSPLANNVA